MQHKFNDTKPKLTIGIPVYNGERFLRQKLDSLLSQTFTDFQIIISDNASTDSTQEICKEYEKRDKRITYIQQEKNIGSKNNFMFVLQQAETKYFVWSAVDDIMEPQFLEKNINVLDSNNEFVGCISKIDYYVDDQKQSKSNFIQLDSIVGTYEKKVRFYLRNSSANMIYAVYRTADLQKCKVLDPIGAWDSAIILSVLKYGNIHVISDTLLHFYSGGISSAGIVYRYMQPDRDIKIQFPNSFFLYWCMKNLGPKIFLKNIDIFIWLNCGTTLNILSEVIKPTKKWKSRRD